jgi:hypothetical protein
VVAVFILFFAVQDIGPSWRARFGESGTPGTFTAMEEDCSGRGGCSYWGEFVSDDGSIVRRDVILGSGHGDVTVGDSTLAYDVGDRAAVYPPGGGHDWIFVTLLLMGSVLFLGAWIWFVALLALRRAT